MFAIKLPFSSHEKSQQVNTNKLIQKNNTRKNDSKMNRTDKVHKKVLQQLRSQGAHNDEKLRIKHTVIIQQIKPNLRWDH